MLATRQASHAPGKRSYFRLAFDATSVDCGYNICIFGGKSKPRICFCGSPPLAAIEVSGRRWVWALWGEVQWVRNQRAQPTAPPAPRAVKDAGKKKCAQPSWTRHSEPSFRVA